MTFSTNH